MALRGVYQHRHLGVARRAPGGPEVQHHGLAAKIPQALLLAGGVLEGQIGGLLRTVACRLMTVTTDIRLLHDGRSKCQLGGSTLPFRMSAQSGAEPAATCRLKPGLERRAAMKLNRSIALVLMTSVAVAIFAWSLAHSRARKAVASASRQLAPDDNPGLVLAGTIIPAITTPIIGRNLNLAIPLNTWVERGEVIGTAESQTDRGEMDSARQELEEATSAERMAEDGIRQAEEELGTLRSQVTSMDGQESVAETAEFDAEREFERRDILFHSGLASRLEYEAAVAARDSHEAALSSIRSNLAAAAIKIHEWEAKAQEARVTLDEATTRRNAAEVVFEQMQGPIDEPIFSPAAGIIVASGQPVGPSFGIASDPRQLCAYAMVRQADLMAVGIGQQFLIVLDAQPGVTLHATVSAVSETPGDSSAGPSYEVAFVVDNPGGTWLSDAAMHAFMTQSSR
jgi:multidrug resistance efflux pump